MKLNYLLPISLATVIALGPMLPQARAEDPDQTAVTKEFERREENLGKLSIEDQLIVRAAQQKALEDPEVKAALVKRDQANVEFREKLRAAMIAADRKAQPILEKIAAGTDPGLSMGR